MWAHPDSQAGDMVCCLFAVYGRVPLRLESPLLKLMLQVMPIACACHMLAAGQQNPCLLLTLGPAMLLTLQPYEVFAMLWKHPEQWQQVFLGDYDPSALAHYWESMAASNWKSCPVVKHPDLWQDRGKVVPWFTHSDGGEVYRNKVHTVYSWSSPFSHNVDAKDAKLYIMMLDEMRDVHGMTEGQITDYLHYQDDVLRSGKHPFENSDGSPVTGHKLKLAGEWLAGGYKACCVGWTGDLKEEMKVHQLCRNYNCNFMCKKCLGCRHKESGNAYDFRANAFWIRERISHETYLATTPPDHQSPWVRMDGWTIYRNREDELHQIWLGFGKDHRDGAPLTR